MNRGFPRYWERSPRRGHGGWFHPNYMPNQNFWRDGGWNTWDNCFPDRPPPHWDQRHPEQQRAYDGNNFNFQGRGRSRGYFHEKHGRSYRGSKHRFSKERGSFQKSSHSSRSIDSMQNKKECDSEKVEAQSTASEETKQGKKDSATLVNKTDPPKEASCTISSPWEFSFRLPTDSSACPENKEEVLPKKKEDIEAVGLGASPETEGYHRESCPTLAVVPSSAVTLEDLTLPKEEEEIELIQTEVQLKDIQASEDPPSQAAPAKAPTEEQIPSETTEHLPTMEKEEPVLVKLKIQQGCKYLPSQTVPMSSAGEPTEEQTPSETTEALHPTEQEDSVLLEAKHSSHASSPLDEEISFLSEITDDHYWCEIKEEIDLIQISSSCEDVHCHHAYVAPAVNCSNLPSTFGDIRCVPVLVREGGKKLHYSWESASFHAENPSGWAPEDYQEPPWSVSQTSQCNEVSENDEDSVLSQSPPHALISCDQKCDTERLLEYRSYSPKSHHSSDSKHCSSNWAPRELRVQTSRSPRRREPSSRSPHRHRPRSPHRHHSRSPHRQRSRSPCRREYRSRLPFRRGYSPQRQEKSSRSPWRRREDFGRSYSHCKCSCNPSQGNTWKRDSSSSYLAHKINHHDSLKERRQTYEVPLSYSPESPTLVCKIKTNSQKIKKKKITQLERTEKKKRTSSRTVAKSIKIKKKARLTPSAAEAPIPLENAQHFQPLRTEESEQLVASSENLDSPHHPSTGEETRFSASSWTPYKYSAAVLARKEEIKQAYLQAVLNFAVVAAMLVDKEPCMEKAMESALRANLRRIGGYYEQLLKNYIDSLAETNGKET